MTYKDLLHSWVEDRKWENDDGTWQIYDPFDGLMEDHIFLTEKQIDEVLWSRAMKLDATEFYTEEA